jgi:hypothetical protein
MSQVPVPHILTTPVHKDCLDVGVRGTQMLILQLQSSEIGCHVVQYMHAIAWEKRVSSIFILEAVGFLGPSL